jgi:hypothetical protein
MERCWCKELKRARNLFYVVRIWEEGDSDWRRFIKK